MESKDSESETIDEQVLSQLVEYRTRFYENLANDALSLLSIQLLVLPVSISIISLLIEVAAVGSSSSESVSPVARVIENVDYSLFRPGATIGIATIILSVLVYHMSRKLASEQANLLLEHHYPDEVTTELNEEEAPRLVVYLYKAYEDLRRDHKKYFDTCTYEDTVKTPFDEFWMSFGRASFTAALIGTPISAALLLLSLVKSIYEPATYVALFLTRNALVLVEYIAIPVIAILLLEQVVGTLPSILVAVLDKYLRPVLRSIKQVVVANPLPISIVSFSFLLMSSSTFVLRGESGLLLPISIVIGLITTIFGIVVLIFKLIEA